MGLGIESQTRQALLPWQCNCRCPTAPEPISAPPHSSSASKIPQAGHQVGCSTTCYPISWGPGDATLCPPAQPVLAKGLRERAPIGPTGPQAPDPLPPGGLETSARVHFISRAWDSLLLPLSFASATQSHSFSASKWGLWGSLHQGSGAALKGGTRGLTPALWRDLLCLRKALRAAPALRPTEGNAAGSGDLFCRRQL